VDVAVLSEAAGGRWQEVRVTRRVAWRLVVVVGRGEGHSRIGRSPVRAWGFKRPARWGRIEAGARVAADRADEFVTLGVVGRTRWGRVGIVMLGQLLP